WAKMPNVELWLAGVRVPETAEIDRQIATLPAHWRNQVKDLDSISETDKASLLGSGRCLVLPSKAESFGMVILEAWAHATPVVAWALRVFRGIVENGRTGVLADPSGGAHALGQAILRILKDSEGATRMGKAGHRQAATAYSWPSAVDAYLKAYEYAARSA